MAGSISTTNKKQEAHETILTCYTGFAFLKAADHGSQLSGIAGGGHVKRRHDLDHTAARSHHMVGFILVFQCGPAAEVKVMAVQVDSTIDEI